MMDITKSREEFEKWAEKNGYRMDLIPYGDIYSYSSTLCSWEAWQASRESIEVDLDHLGYIQVEEDVFYPDLDAIRHLLVSSGIRIKGESE